MSTNPPRSPEALAAMIRARAAEEATEIDQVLAARGLNPAMRAVLLHEIASCLLAKAATLEGSTHRG